MELGRGEVDSVRLRLIAARPKSHDAARTSSRLGRQGERSNAGRQRTQHMSLIIASTSQFASRE